MIYPCSYRTIIGINNSGKKHGLSMDDRSGRVKGICEATTYGNELRLHLQDQRGSM